MKTIESLSDGLVMKLRNVTCVIYEFIGGANCALAATGALDTGALPICCNLEINEEGIVNGIALSTIRSRLTNISGPCRTRNPRVVYSNIENCSIATAIPPHSGDLNVAQALSFYGPYRKESDVAVTPQQFKSMVSG
jgi:hypothetical protein